MLSSRLFWKLMLACAGLNVAAAIVFGVVLSDWLQNRILEQVDSRLREAALVASSELAGPVPDVPSEALQERFRRLGRETDTRFTLVAPGGTVLADSARSSQAEVRAMDNHRNRPELVQARTHGEGASLRPSATLSTTQHYFALRLKSADGATTGFVRTALPADTIGDQMAVVRRVIWGTVAVVCVVVVGLSYWIVGHIIRPVDSLTAAADAIAAGDYRHRVYVTNQDELGTLAGTFNRMSQELDARMRQLGQTGDRQSTVLGGMIEGVIAVDDRQRIVLANQAAGRLFDFRPHAAEGRPLLEVVRNHEVQEAVAGVLADGQPQRLETKTGIVQAAGAVQHFNIHVQPMPGRPCPGVVLVMHDTTDLRRLESLRRDFIANVSHELKTPLSSIKAYTETLRDGAIDDVETSRKFLDRIAEQADRLHHLIIDMLMLARIESDQQAFEIVAVDVAEVAGSCLEAHRPAAEAKQIGLVLKGAPSADQPGCCVRADREGLREILDNLVDNAIKYTPEGGTVTVAWRGGEHGAGSGEHGPGSGGRAVVQIVVRDTGIGIKPDDQRRVFERFFRVDKARSREMGGTGLGLAIVKHLVQSFGGTVAVESEPGQGSAFTVELPSG